jgi:hypothetical protein
MLHVHEPWMLFSSFANRGSLGWGTDHLIQDLGYSADTFGESGEKSGLSATREWLRLTRRYSAGQDVQSDNRQNTCCGKRRKRDERGGKLCP